jgi:hypothetical protein
MPRRSPIASCFRREATLAPHEFVCADCKADVFSFGDLMPGPRCASCDVVQELKARDGMSPEAETELRDLLGCQLPREEEQ